MNIDEFVLGQNIAHYRDQLKTAENKVKQQTLRNLLAEAEAGLQLKRPRVGNLRRAPHAEPITTP